MLYLSSYVNNLNFFKNFFPGKIVARSGLGYMCIVLFFFIIKSILHVVDLILKKIGLQITDEVLRRHIPLIDITYKYLTFYLVSFNIMFLVPLIYKWLGVERLTFYQEAK